MVILFFAMKRVRVSLEVYEKLARRAKEKGMSISDFVSFLVQEVG
jgi:predicted CopG family antitoxin